MLGRGAYFHQKRKWKLAWAPPFGGVTGARRQGAHLTTNRHRVKGRDPRHYRRTRRLLGGIQSDHSPSFGGADIAALIWDAIEEKVART
jgi:hypothetical protein